MGDTTHHHDDGSQTRKKIYQTTVILSLLTAVEFIIAFSMGPGTLRLSIFLIMTLVKAFYIVSVFMHLGDEVKRLAWSILIPFAFIMWLLIAMSKEGDHYGNLSLKDANMTRVANPAVPHGGHDAQHDAPKTGDTHAADAHSGETQASHSDEAAKGTNVELGEFSKKKLVSGVELNIPANGIENKLIAFIEDASKPVDKTTWFSFDRLVFETGKAVLKTESQEQLGNIASILAAYPKANLKIGGYTDNTGDAKGNLNLSQERANTVKAGLIKLGVDAKRLEAEGYGQEHPIASNDTEGGRAKNRRIDVRVTQK